MLKTGENIIHTLALNCLKQSTYYNPKVKNQNTQKIYLFNITFQEVLDQTTKSSLSFIYYLFYFIISLSLKSK